MKEEKQNDLLFNNYILFADKYYITGRYDDSSEILNNAFTIVESFGNIRRQAIFFKHVAGEYIRIKECKLHIVYSL